MSDPIDVPPKSTTAPSSPTRPGPVAPKAPEPTARTVEEWRDRQLAEPGVTKREADNMRAHFEATKVFKGWPQGLVMSESEYDKAIEEACHTPMFGGSTSYVVRKKPSELSKDEKAKMAEDAQIAELKRAGLVDADNRDMLVESDATEKEEG